MANSIPSSLIGAVSSVIAAHYFSHSTIESLLMESGAPGDPPEGNLEMKISNWLKRCNDQPTVDALSVLGQVIQQFMDCDPSDTKMADGQKRISESLAKNQLSYQVNGYVMIAGASPVAKSLSALRDTGMSRLVVSGGVGANRWLRSQLSAQAATRGAQVFYPPLELCTDNGAMIAFAAALRIQANPGLLTETQTSFNVRSRWALANA